MKTLLANNFFLLPRCNATRIKLKIQITLRVKPNLKKIRLTKGPGGTFRWKKRGLKFCATVPVKHAWLNTSFHTGTCQFKKNIDTTNTFSKEKRAVHDPFQKRNVQYMIYFKREMCSFCNIWKENYATPTSPLGTHSSNTVWRAPIVVKSNLEVFSAFRSK